jgi:hypothetical protein
VWLTRHGRNSPSVTGAESWFSIVVSPLLPAGSRNQLFSLIFGGCMVCIPMEVAPPARLADAHGEMSACGKPGTDLGGIGQGSRS